MDWSLDEKLRMISVPLLDEYGIQGMVAGMDVLHTFSHLDRLREMCAAPEHKGTVAETAYDVAIGATAAQMALMAIERLRGVRPEVLRDISADGVEVATAVLDAAKALHEHAALTGG